MGKRVNGGSGAFKRPRGFAPGGWGSTSDRRSGAGRRNLQSVTSPAPGIFNSLRLLLWFLWIRPQRDARQNLLETFFADATDN